MKKNPYASEQTRLAMVWKQRTGSLPDAARAPGTYARRGLLARGARPHH